jgi:hypothetical protein
MPLSPEESSLIERLEFDAGVAELFRAATKARLNGFSDVDGHLVGATARVSDGTAAESILKAVQPELLQHGYRAFWTHLHGASGVNAGDALVLLRSKDHFAILDSLKPCPEGHSGPEVIKNKLKGYERLCDMEIVGASHDWVAVAFKSLPQNLGQFAEDIYLFCPDSCDLSSGIGSKGKYTKEVRAAAKALCPTISDDFRQRVKAKFADGPAAAVLPSDFADMLLEDAERNVRLVAWELKQKMYFFFWWD